MRVVSWLLVVSLLSMPAIASAGEPPSVKAVVVNDAAQPVPIVGDVAVGALPRQNASEWFDYSLSCTGTLPYECAASFAGPVLLQTVSVHCNGSLPGAALAGSIWTVVFSNAETAGPGPADFTPLAPSPGLTAITRLGSRRFLNLAAVPTRPFFTALAPTAVNIVVPEGRAVRMAPEGDAGVSATCFVALSGRWLAM